MCQSCSTLFDPKEIPAELREYFEEVTTTCGAPWRRVVERQRLLDGHIPASGAFARPDEPFRIRANGRGHHRYSTVTTEHGWTPTCRCNAPLTPAIVLDPFCGSGTTLLTARALGRHGVGLDLSWPYLAEIARERLQLNDPQQSLFTGPAVAAERWVQEELFAEVAMPTGTPLGGEQ